MLMKVTFSLTDEAVAVMFELSSYDVVEGQSTVEVCVVTSATPAAGQVVSVIISTEDGSAIGNSSVTLVRVFE